MNGIRRPLSAVLAGLMTVSYLLTAGLPATPVAAAATPALPIGMAAAQAEPGSPVTWGIVPSSVAGPDGRAAFDYKLDPGAELTDYAGLFNFTDQPLTVAVYASDAFTTEQGGFDLLPSSQPPVDVGTWVRIELSTVTIPARSRVDVPFRLTVPANATPGDHVGGVVASVPGLGTDAAGNQLSVDRRVGARIYLRVSGELAPAFRVEQLAANYRGTVNPFDTGAVTSTFVVRNTGNVRLVGRPEIEVDGPFGLGGWTTRHEPLPEILPGGQLQVTARTDGVRALLRLSVTARAAPVAAAAGAPLPQTASAQLTLWVVPWPAVWLLVLVTAVAAALWLRAHRRRRRAAELASRLEAAREQGKAEALAEVGAGTTKEGKSS